MKILLTCTECDYQKEGSSGELMNKIIMWNHVKVAHARTAERVMRNYQMMPSHLYGVRPAAAALG